MQQRSFHPIPKVGATKYRPRVADDPRVTLRVPAPLLDKVKALAAADHRSLNAYLVVLLEQHIADRGK